MSETHQQAATMTGETPETSASTPAEPTEACDQPNVINRVASLPMVSSTLTQVSNAYNWTKDKSSLMRYTLEMAEKSVAMAATTAKPVVDQLEKPICAANEFANQQMDKLEEKVPMINDTPEKVLANMKDGTWRVIDNTKKASSDRINNLLLTRLGKLVTTGVDTALLVSEFAVDYYLPQETSANGTGDAPQQQVVDVAAGGDDDPLMDDKPLEASVQRATRLTNKVRHRVVNRAMRNIRYAQKRSKETLDRLHHTVDLIDYARNNIDNANHAIQARIESTHEALWKTWDDWTLEEGEEAGQKAEVQATNGEQKTLAIARNLAGRLRVLSGNIACSVRLLPQNLRTKVEEGRDLAEALYNSLEEVQTIRELPTNVISTAKHQLNRLTEITMSVADFLVASTPLQWLVPNQVRKYIDSSMSNGRVVTESGEETQVTPAVGDHTYSINGTSSQ